jgi:hypothetical protein
MEQEYEKGRKITQADGTVMFIFDGKLHSWEGPALIPQGNNRKREYYLNGLKYSEKDWKERVKGRTGLPWYKGSGVARF